MCDKIISRLTDAARTYGQSLATIVRVKFEMEPDISDMAPTRWSVTLRVTGLGGIVGGEPETLAQQEWKGSGESIKEALVETGKHLRDHINAELFVNKQKCADAEMALREMERDIGDLWAETEDAEKNLEALAEGK